MSTDAAAEKFSSAEDALFGAKGKPDAETPAATKATSAAPPQGRVLRDLNEPPPPPLPELPAPARRGRKPGSKNKPKPALATLPSAPASLATRPSWADAAAERHPASAEAERPSSAAATGEVARETSRSSRSEAGPAGRRTRLRDRSTILKRYVLGTEPAPGQTGWVRALRAKRQG